MTQAEIENAIEFLLKSQAALTAATQANTAAIKTLVERMDASNAQADLDRAAIKATQDESRDAINAMISYAEEMADNVRLLTTNDQQQTVRIERLERKVKRLENPAP